MGDEAMRRFMKGDGDNYWDHPNGRQVEHIRQAAVLRARLPHLLRSEATRFKKRKIYATVPRGRQMLSPIGAFLLALNLFTVTTTVVFAQTGSTATQDNSTAPNRTEIHLHNYGEFNRVCVWHGLMVVATAAATRVARTSESRANQRR